MNATGWKCPGCSACYAPTVNECHRCAPEKAAPIKAPDLVPHWPYPVPTISIPSVWRLDEPVAPCRFDGLPPGVYGMVCECPRCTPQFSITTAASTIGPVSSCTFLDARGMATDNAYRIGKVSS